MSHLNRRLSSEQSNSAHTFNSQDTKKLSIQNDNYYIPDHVLMPPPSKPPASRSSSTHPPTTKSKIITPPNQTIGDHFSTLQDNQELSIQNDNPRKRSSNAEIMPPTKYPLISQTHPLISQTQAKYDPTPTLLPPAIIRTLEKIKITSRIQEKLNKLQPIDVTIDFYILKNKILLHFNDCDILKTDLMKSFSNYEEIEEYLLTKHLKTNLSDSTNILNLVEEFYKSVFIQPICILTNILNHCNNIKIIASLLRQHSDTLYRNSKYILKTMKKTNTENIKTLKEVEKSTCKHINNILHSEKKVRDEYELILSTIDADINIDNILYYTSNTKTSCTSIISTLKAMKINYYHLIKDFQDYTSIITDVQLQLQILINSLNASSSLFQHSQFILQNFTQCLQYCNIEKSPSSLTSSTYKIKENQMTTDIKVEYIIHNIRFFVCENNTNNIQNSPDTYKIFINEQNLYKRIKEYNENQKKSLSIQTIAPVFSKINLHLSYSQKSLTNIPQIKSIHQPYPNNNYYQNILKFMLTVVTINRNINSIYILLSNIFNEILFFNNYLDNLYKLIGDKPDLEIYKKISDMLKYAKNPQILLCIKKSNHIVQKFFIDKNNSYKTINMQQVDSRKINLEIIKPLTKCLDELDIIIKTVIKFYNELTEDIKKLCDQLNIDVLQTISSKNDINMRSLKKETSSFITSCETLKYTIKLSDQIDETQNDPEFLQEIKDVTPIYWEYNVMEEVKLTTNID